ncbi:MAG: LamG domain-containing protein [Candidatus Pacebacteria bacterium]|nr:LamG domain-containing protein [Candidatus Paceibacterota bacterium]
MFWIIKKSKRQKGFTFIELMLVVSMIAMLSAMTIPISFGSLKKQSVEEEASQLLSVLRQTQAKSMKGRDDSLWGVYFTPETYTSFKGNSYEERDPLYDEVFELYSDITIAGAPEIVFDNSGKPQIEGLVGHWTMNEGEGGVAHDLSGQENHGTLVNDPTWANGKVGGALDFDGTDDYVNCGSGTSLDSITTQVSISQWIKFNTSQNTRCFIFRRLDTSHSSYAIGVDDSTNNIIKFYTLTDTGNSNTLTSPLTYNDGNWHNVVGVWNGTNKFLYIDGMQVATIAFSGTMNNWGSANLYLGSLSGYAQFFNGSIDDIRIYNRALTAEEIRLIYESGLDGVDDNIIELSDGSDSVKINVGRQGRIEVVR